MVIRPSRIKYTNEDFKQFKENKDKLSTTSKKGFNRLRKVLFFSSVGVVVSILACKIPI
jgi:hypothetical protein